MMAEFRVVAGGLRHAAGSAGGRRARTSSWRRATFRERMPPPTGVVSGPLMPTCGGVGERRVAGAHVRLRFTSSELTGAAPRSLRVVGRCVGHECMRVCVGARGKATETGARAAGGCVLRFWRLFAASFAASQPALHAQRGGTAVSRYNGVSEQRTRYFLKASRVSVGSHWPVLLKAFSPAST